MESRAQDIVAVIEVLSTRYYERDGGFGYPIDTGDGGETIIWGSPPEFEVRARLVRQLYGPRLRRTVIFMTHSHWGTRDFEKESLRLVHLRTDGDVTVMPNYESVEAGADINGRLFIAAHPEEETWLPCGHNALKEPMTIKAPANIFGDDYEEPVTPLALVTQKQVEQIQLKQLRDKNWYVIVGDRRYPRFGVSIESLTKFLAEKRPKRNDFRCDRDDHAA